MSSTGLIKLYGVPLSQPTRSVTWALLLKQVPFDFVLTIPGSDKPGLGARREDFKSKTKARSVTVPLLEDNNNNNTSTLAITESAAILIHLCESRNWWDFYAKPKTLDKATIDSYLHWHHTHTRRLSRISGTYLSNQPPLEKEEEVVHNVLSSLEEGWFHSTSTYNYIATDNHPSIADLMCYEEIAQIYLTGVLQSLQDYPNVAAWVKRMEQLPYHQAVHTALTTLGNFKTTSPHEPLHKRLSQATKAGILALKEAQKDFIVKQQQESEESTISKL